MSRTDINAGSQPTDGGQVVVSSYIGQTNTELDPYPTHYSQLGSGGLRTVTDNADRDAISTDMRQEGMLCYVEASQAFFQLLPDLITWQPFSGGSGGLLRVNFINQTDVIVNNVTDHPLVQIYYEDPSGLFRPLEYGTFNATYGQNEYAQSVIPADQLITYFNAPPQVVIKYAPTQAQSIITFDAPQTGRAILSF